METEPLLRRRVREHVHAPANVGISQSECTDSGPRRLGWLPSVCFVVTYAVFLIVGVVAVLLPPPVRARVANQDVPDDAMCYRVIRKADYVTVEYAIGGPTRRVQVLLRLDKVVGDAEHAVRIFSERVVESRSMQCDASNGTCYDTILVTNGSPNAGLALVGLQFEYTNPTKEYERSDVAKYRLGLAGEMYAARGYRYYLSNSHLCVSKAAVSSAPSDASDALAAWDADDGRGGRKVQTNDSSIAAMPVDLLGGAAVYQAYHGSECIGGLDSVDVLPYEGGSEQVYLAIEDTSLYESEPSAVLIRRQIVELGYVCAGSLARYERAFNMYDFDCNNAPYFDHCRQEPSLPHRRVSTYDIRAHYTADGPIYFWFKDDPTLASLPGLANSAEAVLLAVVKLSLLILAAAVMWVRSDKVTSSSHWLYRHCVRVANCLPPHERSKKESSVLEDAALGMIALTARFVVGYWRLGALAAENQMRVCVVEIAAASLSLVSWILRFWVIEPNLPDLIGGKKDDRGPLTRLGGSMAIADASCAVLLAFAEPPIHLSAISRFDDTARLLVGLVISLVTLHRCLFAVACNSIILEAHWAGLLTRNPPYQFVLVLAGTLWIGQTAALAVGMADLVATPMAFTITRGVIGDDLVVGVAVYMAMVCVSLPRLMHTAVKLIEVPE